MPLSTDFSRYCQAAILAAVLLLSMRSVPANSLEEDSAKAGFIFNFAKYTEWPATAMEGGELHICSLSPQSLSGKLELLQGRQIQGKRVQVRTATRPSEWRSCHVIYIAEDEEQRVDMALRNMNPYPILTVSDVPGFAQAGGVIGLKLRAGRIRFDINHGAARQSGLKLSSQLLKLADEVVP